MHCKKPSRREGEGAFLRIAVVVQGLFELSDSIGYDAVFQYIALREMIARGTFQGEARLYAERFVPAHYPGVSCNSFEKLKEDCKAHPETLLIYHFCDGWPALDQFIAEQRPRTIVRWHNNTPPWFYAVDNPRAASRSVSGFRQVLEFCRNPAVRFWVNSEFTKSQLLSLAAAPVKAHVVFPASRYLEASEMKHDDATQRSDGDAINVLFVGRVVAHKGYLHIIAACELAQALSARPIRVNVAGRLDSSASAFNRQFAAAIASEIIDVRHHGEVTEEELRRFYRTADVFLCLSEHEGFGMPVFEAMRCGVPVVAWATTALQDLLEGHPLAFRQFSLADFAAAVVNAAQPGTRAAVDLVQREILKKYSKPVVLHQISEGITWLNGQEAPPQDACGSESGCDLHKLISMARSKAGGTLPGNPHDSAANLVSLYDLAVHEHLFEAHSRWRRPQGANGTEERQSSSLLLACSEFFSADGKLSGDHILIGAQAAAGQHAVFGPYVSIPRGRYEARWLLDGTARTRMRFDIDIATERSGVLRRQTVDVPARATPGDVRLAFEIVHDMDLVEFRIGSCDASSPLLFSGVLVRRQPTFHELGVAREEVSAFLHEVAAMRAQPAASPKPPAGLWKIVRGLKFAPYQAARQRRAMLLFAKGDEARRIRDWGAAAHHYDAGLALAPAEFPYWVQLGHARKEHGQHAAALEAYMTAFRLQPGDADLNLQIGYLHKHLKSTLLAELYFLRAAQAGRPALLAINELRGLGIREDEAMQFIEGTA